MIREQIHENYNLIELIDGVSKMKRVENVFQWVCPFCKSLFLFAHEKEWVWHCYQCERWWTTADFIKQIKNFEFETLALLCDFPEEAVFKSENEYKTCSLLMSEYQKFFTNPSNKKIAQDYLLSRGISKEIIEKFWAWYAPDRYSIANDIPMGYHKKIFQKNSYGYNTFQDRIVFPFYDIDGKILWYSGRDTSGLEWVPKYLNTWHTPLFIKKQIAYWIFQAKESIIASQSVILCEGQIDVLSWHEVWYTQAIGVSGTALSDYHIKLLLSLGVETFYLAFDFDEAGEKATERAIEILKPTKKEIRILEKFTKENVKDMNDVLLMGELYNINFTKYEHWK